MMESVARCRKVIAGVAAVVLVSIVGCSSPSDNDTTMIGVSYPTANSPFWVAYNAFIDDGAAQLGVDITAVSADGNEQKQLADVQNLISRGVDGLILTPQSTAIAPALLRAASLANIPVVIVDRYPGYDPGENVDADYVAFIGPNDYKAGADLAEALIAVGGSQFLALGGAPGSSVAQGRKDGLEQVMKNHQSASEAELVQYQAAGESEENGLSNAENLLQAHPDDVVNTFWCYNDNLCMGALKAARNAGRENEFLFGGMDLTPQAITAIRDGDYAMSFGGHWLEGGFGLAMLYDALHGKAPLKPVISLDLMKVDRTNVEQFSTQFIDQPARYDFTQLTQVHNGGTQPDFQITMNR